MMRQPVTIFRATVPVDDADPAYTFVRTDATCKGDRRLLERMWTGFRKVADPHFHDQIQRDFQSRAWEMRLGGLLIDLGFRPRSAPSGPDFTVASKNGEIHFEAVAPGPGIGQLAVRKPQAGALVGIASSNYLLRYAQAITEKHKKHQEYLAAGAVRPDKPFVIALSAAKIPLAFAEDPEFPRVLKGLFGLGKAYVSYEVGTGRQTGAGYEHVPARAKPSGADVAADLFLREEMSSISALIFTPHHALNWSETRGGPKGSDLVTVHNPLAANPLSLGFFPFGREFAIRARAIVLTNDWRASLQSRQSPSRSIAENDESLQNQR